MMKQNKAILNVQESLLSSFNSYLKTIPNIKLLTYGDPTKEVSFPIKQIVMEEFLQNKDHYQSAQGEEKIRQAICNHENQKLNMDWNSDNVLVTNGATEALFITFSILTNPGDEVIIFSPYYPTYLQLCDYFQCKKIVIQSKENFQIDTNELGKKITSKCKLILFNYPNNPTGLTLHKDEINQIVKILHYHQKPYLVFDQIYDELIYQKHPLFPYSEFKNRVILINSFSKSHGMTGWRIGYLLAHLELIESMKKLKQIMNVCQPSFLLAGVFAALNIPSDIEIHHKKMDIAMRFLNKIGLKFYKPDGGLYIFFSIEQFKMDSISFCKFLAEKYQVGLIPGIYFGKEGYVRLSISGSEMELNKALINLKKCLKKVANPPLTNN